MRKWLRLGLCLGLLTVALTCSALAATEGYTTDVDGTVDYADGKYTASYTGVTSGDQYALLVVAGTPEDYTISEDSIMYIDQMAAEGETITFTFIPRSTPDCVVLLGGTFSGSKSPKVLGTLESQGVTVSGSVTLQGRTDYSGATVTLTGDGGTFTGETDSTGAYSLDGVAPGSYKLTITMPGYLPYTKTTLVVEDTVTVETKALLGGEIEEDGQVTILDLSQLLGDYGKEVTTSSDIDGDGQVTILDLSILLGNYNQAGTTEA